MKKTHIIPHHFNGTIYDKYASSLHHDANIVNQWHKQRWPNFKSSLGWHVGYHYLIESDGIIVQTREDWEEGAHVRGMNSCAIGIGLAGNFTQGSPDKLTQAQKDSWHKLAVKLMRRHEIPRHRIHPHRRYAPWKDCYGNKYSDTYFQDILIETEEKGVETKVTEWQVKELQKQINWIIRLLAQIKAQLQERVAMALGRVSKKAHSQEII